MGAAPSLVLGGQEYDGKFHLYQGGEDVLDDIQWFQTNRITHVVSICHRTVGAEVVKETNLPNENIIHIDELDSTYTDLSKYFEKTTRFIHDARLNGGNVYVHCAAGISRSSTISLAYLMTWFDQPFDELFPRLMMMRKCVSPNSGFVKQLKRWECEPTRHQIRSDMLQRQSSWSHIHDKDRITFLEMAIPTSIHKDARNPFDTFEEDDDY
jgi:atypical dual specificity phosphatase